MGGYRSADPSQCREVFERMRKDGSLSKCAAEVVGALLAAPGPRTAGELAAAMAHAGPNHANRNNVSTRLSELEGRGVVKPVATRNCGVTSSRVYEWELTGELAGPRAKRPPSRARQLEDLLLKISTALRRSESTGVALSPEACGLWAKRVSDRITTIKKG